MTQDANADYVSSPEAAEILRITYVGVAQLARQGKIPAVKIANRWLIPKAFLEEFARTYEGRRGRPRKKAQSGEDRNNLATVRPEGPGSADTGVTLGVRDSGPDTGDTFAVGTPIHHPEETPAPVAHLAGLTPDTTATLAAGDSIPDVDAALAINVPADQPEVIPAASPPASELETSEADATSQPTDSSGATDDTFSISAQVYHLDKNYDFEVYEKGEITEHARLIVARLKPKIPSLPQFSFRWDYRYQHLNVDIHGVETAVVDWWTMGENGYTGHLPRRLGGPGYAFESVIWLPVTFVFRGRLTLSLRDSPEAEEDSSSVATTTGGLRKLWAKWPKIHGSE
ncbi:MAG: helix-turn-helix domain-containing protein [Dehalococcoidia bacterium]|nr:helix-turn-helix domain-containing protein [Dehalococcoidia bacterium]